MGWIRSIASEVYGLFVDDGRFAAAIIVWLVVNVIVLARVGTTARWTGPLLFVGLAVILIANVLRFAQRYRK